MNLYSLLIKEFSILDSFKSIWLMLKTVFISSLPYISQFKRLIVFLQSISNVLREIRHKYWRLDSDKLRTVALQKCYVNNFSVLIDVPFWDYLLMTAINIPVMRRLRKFSAIRIEICIRCGTSHRRANWILELVNKEHFLLPVLA